MRVRAPPPPRRRRRCRRPPPPPPARCSPRHSLNACLGSSPSLSCLPPDRHAGSPRLPRGHATSSPTRHVRASGWCQRWRWGRRGHADAPPVQGRVAAHRAVWAELLPGLCTARPSLQMAIREVAFAKITGVFKRHGAVSIDTPVFELRWVPGRASSRLREVVQRAAQLEAVWVAARAALAHGHCRRRTCTAACQRTHAHAGVQAHACTQAPACVHGRAHTTQGAPLAHTGLAGRR